MLNTAQKKFLGNLREARYYVANATRYVEEDSPEYAELENLCKQLAIVSMSIAYEKFSKNKSEAWEVLGLAGGDDA